MPGGVNAQLLQIELDTRQSVMDAQRQAEDAMRMQQDANLAAIGARALAQARAQDIAIAEMERAKDEENKASIKAQQGGEAEAESPVDALGGLFSQVNSKNPEAGVVGLSGIEMFGGSGPSAMPRGSQGGGPQGVQRSRGGAEAMPGGVQAGAVSGGIDFGSAPERTQTYRNTTQTDIPANAITGVSQRRVRETVDEPNVLTPAQILQAKIQARYYDEQVAISNKNLNYEMLKGAAELDIKERDLARKINNDMTKLKLERYDLFVGQLAKTGLLADAGDVTAKVLYNAQIQGLDERQLAEIERRTQALRSDEAMGSPIAVWDPNLGQNILVSPLKAAEDLASGKVMYDKVTGKKMTFTGADGSTFEMTSGNEGFMHPGGALSNEIIKNAGGTIAKLERLEGLMADTKDEYFGWGNRGSNWLVSKGREIAPGLIPDSMADKAADYNVWKKNVAKNFNNLIFEQGGKTLTANEKQRAEVAELHENMDDVTFRKVMERDYQMYRLGLLRERIVAAGMLSDPKIIDGLSKAKSTEEFYDNYFGLDDTADWYRNRVGVYTQKIQERTPNVDARQAKQRAMMMVDAELGVMLVTPPAKE